MKTRSRFIVVAHLPACSAVLFVNPRLEKHHQVTILREDTREYCIAYAAGYRAGNSTIEHKGEVDLPIGNPATSYKRLFWEAA